MAVQESTLRVAIDARKAKKGANDFKKASKDVEKGAVGASNSLKNFNRIGTRSDKTTNVLTSSLKRLFIGFSAFLVLKSSLGILTDFETGMVGVAKTTDLAGKELAQLSDEIIRLSTQIPVTTNQLLEIAQSAGQLGVQGADNILLFTETIAKLGVASNLAGEQAATVLARLLNITGESVSTIDTLASVIVALGNNFATTEAEIAQFGTRIATTTALFNVSSAEALALGTALSALGQNAEAGGTVIGRAFIQIDKAIRAGGKSLDDLSKLTGKTTKEITKLFRRDSVKGFQLFIEGLEKVIESGGDASAELEKFGLTGLRAVPILSTLAKNSNILADALETASKETKNATALNKESEAAFDTLASKTTILTNTIKAFVTQFKESNGILKEAVVFATDVIRALIGMESSIKGNVFIALSLASAIKVLTVALTILAVMKIVPIMIAFTATMIKATATTIGWGVATKAVTVAQNAQTVATVASATATTGLTVAMAINPFTFWLVAITSVVAVMTNFFGLLDSGASKLDKLDSQIDGINSKFEKTETNIERVIKSLARLSTERTRGQEFGTIEEEITVINRLINTLKEQSVSFRVFEEQFKSPIILGGKKVEFPSAKEISKLLSEIVGSKEDIQSIIGQVVSDRRNEFAEIIKRLSPDLGSEELQKAIDKSVKTLAQTLGTFDEKLGFKFLTFRDVADILELKMLDLRSEADKLESSLASSGPSGVKSFDEINKVIKSSIDFFSDLINKTQEFINTSKAEFLIDQLKKQNEFLKLNRNEQEEALAVNQIANKLARDGITLTEQQILNIRGLITERQKDREAIKQQAEATEKLKDAFKGVGDRLKEIKDNAKNLFANIGKDIAGFALPSFLGGVREPTDFGAIAGDPEKNPFGLSETQIEQLDKLGFAFDGLAASALNYLSALTSVADATNLATRAAFEPMAAALSATTGAFIEQAIAGQISGRLLAKSALEASSGVLKAIAQEASAKAIFALAEGLFFKDPSKIAAAKLYASVAGVAGAGAIALGRLASGIGGGEDTADRTRSQFGGGGQFQAGNLTFTGAPVTRTEDTQTFIFRFEGEPGGLSDNTEFTDKLIETIVKRVGDGKTLIRRA